MVRLSSRFLLCLMYIAMVSLFSCDNYVQFAAPQPKNGLTVRSIPSKYHGIFIEAESGEKTYVIDQDGIFEIETIEYETMPEYAYGLSGCSTVKESIDKAQQNDIDECVTIDFSKYPEAISTLVHRTHVYWNFDSVQEARSTGGNLFLNDEVNDFFDLKSLETTPSGIVIYDWKVSDLVDRDGLISDDLSLRLNDNGLLQFVFGPEAEVIPRLDSSIHKKKVLTLIPVLPRT